MKIFTKIWLIISLVTFVILFFIYVLLKPLITDVVKRDHQNTLFNLSQVILIDFKEMGFDSLNTNSSAEFKNKLYLEAQERIRDFHEIWGENYSIDILQVIDSTNSKIIIRDSLSLFQKELITFSRDLKRTYSQALKVGEIQISEIVYNDSSSFIVSFIPLTNNLHQQNNIVVLIHSEKNIISEINSALHTILFYFLGLIPIIFVLSYVVSRSIVSPFGKLVEYINNLSQKDYSSFEFNKYKGELKKVFTSLDNLRNELIDYKIEITALIDSLKQKNMELERLKEKAETSSRIKSEFLDLISHEIRTPINAIKNLSEIILDDLTGGKYEELDEEIPALNEELFRLIRTVELIATTAELHTDSYDINKTNINLVDLIRHILERYLPEAEKKRLKLSFKSTEHEINIKTDSFLFEKIIENLVDNGIKFTQSGSVEVEVVEQHGCVRIEVRDTGIGISPDFQGVLSSIFTQESSGFSRNYDGLGLGLALVSLGCKLLDIKMTIKSIMHEGSTFTLELKK